MGVWALGKENNGIRRKANFCVYIYVFGRGKGGEDV